MKIRDFILEDTEQVQALCERYGFGFPTEGKIIVAVDETGVIKSFINMRLITYVEPFVADSPFAGKELWDYVEGKIKEGNLPIVRCFTDEKNKSLFERLGFYEVFKNQLSLEKNYYEVPK